MPTRPGELDERRATPRPSSLGAFFSMASVAMLALAMALSYPAMVFNGPLLPHLPMGQGTGLLAAVFLGLAIAALSGYRGVVSYMQASATVMLAVLAASMAQDMLRTQRAEQVLATTVALIALTTMLCGFVLVLLGRYKLGSLIRYVPVPVIAGFLAGTGWLLLKSAIGLSANLPATMAHWEELVSAQRAAQWVPALAAGALLWALERFRPRASNALLLLLALGLAFWLIAAALGMDRQSLQVQGWLFRGPGSHAMWSPQAQWNFMADADWGLLARALPDMLAIALVNAINLLVVASAIEVATDRDLDLDRELRAAGLANLLAGFAGALPGHHSAPATILAKRMGIGGRLVGLCCAAAALVMLLLGGSLLDYLPKILSGALIAWIGLGFLHTWLYERLRLMSVTDRIVTLVVFFTAIIFGITQALAAGAVAGLLLFVVRYSAIPVARDVLGGAASRSNITRGDLQRTILAREGDAIFILKLHSFVFFGTANSLVRMVDRRLQQADLPKLRFLLLDLSLVSGIDSSAAASFAKLERRARQANFKIALVNVPASVRPMLDGALAKSTRGGIVRDFVELDRAQEWAENKLLGRHGVQTDDSSIDFAALLTGIFGPGKAEQALGYVQSQDLAAGEVLTHMGDRSKDIFFIESGRVEVLIPRAGTADLRVGVMEAGALIGEMAMYLGQPRSATLVALTDCRVRKFEAARVQAMEHADPELASALHRHIAAGLASKLVDMNRLVAALKR